MLDVVGHVGEVGLFGFEVVDDVEGLVDGEVGGVMAIAKASMMRMSRS